MRSCFGALVGVTLTVLIAPAAGAQPEPPRTPWGAPDLRGIWNHGTATPLERPERHAGRELLTETEVAAVNAEARSTAGVGARRAVWWERPLSDRRTALITSPPSGRIPYTDDARARLSAMPDLGVDAPEDRSPQERCLTYGIPRLGGPYSQNIHVAQTPDHILLLFEMVHEFRVIPLDGAPHLPPTIRQWLGDSRGRWEGDTLVVETTNFRDQQLFRRLPLDGTRLVERFTRTGGDALRYEVTLDDPALWTQPWAARLDMASTEGPMFEFACHEGNVGMAAMLEIARGDPLRGAGR
jgi:hypothetical protein